MGTRINKRNTEFIKTLNFQLITKAERVNSQQLQQKKIKINGSTSSLHKLIDILQLTNNNSSVE